MKHSLTPIIAILMLAFTSCTKNPFGGNSFVDVTDVSLAWSNKNFDFGNQQIGSSSLQTFLITNEGNVDATNCGAVQLSDNINFSIVSQTCQSATLTPGTSCEVVVESRPQSVGDKVLTLERQCFVKNSTVSLVNQVKVKAIQPTAAWSPLNHNFGTIQTGQSIFEKKFTLSNQGTADIANCGFVTLSNATDFYIQNDTCGLNNISSGGSCEVTVMGRPTSAGLKSTTVSRTCESNFTFSTNLDQITVNGFDSMFALYPANYDLGDIYETTSSTAYLYLQNESVNEPVSCTAAALSDSTNFFISYEDCGTRGLTQWDGCSIYVQSSSSAPIGEHITSVSKSCTFPDTSVREISIPVRVNVLPAVPVLYVFNNSHDFGDAYMGGSGSTNPFYFYNGGYASATGCGQPVLSNTTDFSIVSNNCNGSDITPFNMCDVTVSALTSSVGIKTGTLSMTCADGGTVTATLQQNVKPAAPDLAFSAANYNFGNVGVGSSQDVLVSVLNRGPIDATGCSLPVLSNTTDFSISGDTCSTNDIVGQGTCSLGIRVTPSSTGTKTTTVTKTCTAGGTINFDITATGFLAAPNIYWSSNNYDFGSINAGSNSSTTQIYFVNDGTAAATGCSAPVLADTTNFTITQDTCATNDMSSGWSACYVRIQANPTTAGLKSTQLSRTCSVGGTANSTTNGIQVTGTLNAGWEQENRLAGFNAVGLGKISAPLRYYFVNTNDSDLTGCANPVLSNSTDFTIQNNNCNQATLAYGSTCSVEVVANGTSAGSKTTNLSRTCSESGTKTKSITSNVDNGGNVLLLGSTNLYNCVLLDSGLVKCWGGRYSTTALPTLISGIANAVQISVGNGHGCAKLSDNTVRCWGRSEWGSAPWLGPNYSNANGYETVSVDVPGLTNIISVHASGSMSCAVQSDLTVKCWGGAFSSSLTDVAEFTDMTQLSGYCARKSNNSIRCLSSPNFYGTTVTDALVISTPAGENYAAACYINTSFNVRCRGSNAYGQVGDGTYVDRASFVTVSGVSNAKSIDTTNYKSCAVLTDGTMKCWGGLRELGTYVTPTAITIATGVNTAGGSCGLYNDSSIKCFGQNRSGENGIGEFSYDHIYPRKVDMQGEAVAKVVTRGGLCALKQNGKVHCLGGYGNAYSGVGYNPATPPFSTNGDVYGISNAVDLDAGTRGSICATLSTGAVKCWGDNFYQQFGAGSQTTQYTPFTVPGLSDIRKVAVGFVHFCALDNTGKVFCVGGNDQGQIGDGTTTLRLTPVQILTGVQDIAVGSNFSCALMNTGSVKCWGSNYNGMLGIGSMGGSSYTPVDVVGVANATKISTNESATCAVLQNKTIKCWGYTQGSGIFGTEAFRETGTPVLIPGINNAIDVSYNDLGGCARLDDGKTKCWGNNYQQQFGLGARFVSDSKPSYYMGLSSSITSLGWGNARVQCMVDTVGGLYCSGGNYDTVYVMTPQPVLGL